MASWHDTVGHPEDALAILSDPDPIRTPLPQEGSATPPAGIQAWRRRLLSREQGHVQTVPAERDYFRCHPDRRAGVCGLGEPLARQH